MSHSEFVSIIIPMFNAANFIEQCIGSISHQSWPNIEVIMVDDCSSDDTVDICRSFMKRDNRLKLVQASENGGPGKTRNLGIDVATGDFILFLDADDWLPNDAVEILLNASKGSFSNGDMVVGDFDKIQEGRNETVRVSHFLRDHCLTRQNMCDYAMKYMREPGKFMMFSYCWGRLYSTSIIKRERLKFISHQRICEDVLFNFEYMRYAQKIHYIHKRTYFYRFNRPQSAAMVFVLKGGQPLFFFRDIWTAYFGILSFIEAYGAGISRKDMQNITRLGHISHAIVLLVRACGCSQGKPLFNLVRKMVNDPNVQENLKYYSPLKGQSRLIPLFLKMRLVLPLILLCRYKYAKRYGNQ